MIKLELQLFASGSGKGGRRGGGSKRSGATSAKKRNSKKKKNGSDYVTFDNYDLPF